MRRTTALTLSLAAGLVVVGGSAAAIALNTPSDPGPTASTSPASSAEVVASAPPEESPVPVVDPTTASLLFMIEEEKLAHDVYVTLGELWGSTIFSNISSSESTHQDQVLALLDARDLADPRSGEVGVFTDATLQALYDELIAQGATSRDAAMEVGIAIETKDIADLATAIAAEDEPDVIAVYERLTSGSEKHLAAFERQV